jgi:hypothetical protein
MTYILAGALQGLFWLVALGTALWLVRRFIPTWEHALFKVGVFEGFRIVIARARARLKARRAAPPAP